MSFAAFKLPHFLLVALTNHGWIEMPKTQPRLTPAECAAIGQGSIEPAPGPTVEVYATGPAAYEIHCRGQANYPHPINCLADLPHSVRIVPHRVAADRMGFKLYSIRPGSVYAEAGLENGDVVLSVNGYDLSTPDKALELYLRLTSEPVLRVKLLRHGRWRVLQYRLQK